MRKKTDLLELYFMNLSCIKDKFGFLLPFIFVMIMILMMLSVNTVYAEGIENSPVPRISEEDYLENLKVRYPYVNWAYSDSGLEIILPSGEKFLTYSSENKASEHYVNPTSDITSLVFENLSDVDGGAIYNSDASGINISSVFINNSSSNIGGAIFNSGVLGDINSGFIGNHSIVYGGAIYNDKDAVIKSITGEFNHNSVNLRSVLDSSTAKGGAIYNSGEITEGIINSSFYGNYAFSSSTSLARGGAIYTTTDLIISADGYSSVFSGNYAQNIGNSKDYNAIYVDYETDVPTVLTLRTSNNGSFVFDDSINGREGYYINLENSDGTGVFKFNSLVRNANVSITCGRLYINEQTFAFSDLYLNGGIVSLSDDLTKSYTINSLHSGKDGLTRFEIDLNYNSSGVIRSDFINVNTSPTELVTVYIDKLNVLYNGVNIQDTDIFQEFSHSIITANPNIKLEISSDVADAKYLLGSVQRPIGIVLPTTLNFNQKVYETQEIGKNYGHITVNDNYLSLVSDGVTIWTGEMVQDVEYTGDTLKLLNEHVTDEQKVFQSTNSNDRYIAKSGFGTTFGNINISGTKDEFQISIIDLVNNSGFKVSNVSEINVSNVRFLNAKSQENGAVFNISNGKAILNFDGVEFINSVSSGSGGAVANIATINKLYADFRANKSGKYGGAVYNTGKINNLQGNYESNIALTKNYSGGAIYNTGTITSILSSSFKNNSTSFGGGAVFNNNTINNINADFEGNSSTVSGGGLYNRGVINNISGRFENNGVKGESIAMGGAIYNEGTISSITNSSFIGNYATVDSVRGRATAGAIYTKSSLDIIANNGYEMVVSGNYTRTGLDSFDNANAIYVDNSSATLNFSVTNNAKIFFNDAIDGVYGYKVKLFGNSTGYANFNHYISAKEFELRDVRLTFGASTFQDTYLNLVSGRVDLQDQRAVNYQINSVNIADGINFDIDIISEADGNTICDTIAILNDNNSAGTIFLDRINFNYDTIPDKEFSLRILSSKSIDLACDFDNIVRIGSDGNIQKLDNKFVISTESYYQDKEFSTSLTFADILYKDIIEISTYGHFELFAMEEFNEETSSIVYIKGFNYLIDTIEESPKTSDVVMGDTLKLLSNLQTTQDKMFSATESFNEYFVKDDILDTFGNLTLKGVNEQSTINFTSDRMYQGFDLLENTNLTVDTIKLTGNDNYLINVKSSDAQINLVDAFIDGNIISTGLGRQTYNVFINGSGTTTLNGRVDGADIYLNGGRLNFINDTFSNSNLILNNGVLNCFDNEITTYNISSISAGEDNVLLNIDIDLNNIIADNFDILRNSSSGILHLNNINIIGSIEDLVKSGVESTTISILNTSSTDLRLALTDNAKSYLDKAIYDISDHSSEVFSEINAETNWEQVYEQTYNRDGYIYELKLSESAKDLVLVKTEVHDRFTTSMGDTLKLINESAVSPKKSFVTNKIMIYYVSENLGETVGSLTVKGVKDNGEYSTITLTSQDGYDTFNGFELVAGSVLNLDTIKFTGNKNLITVKSSSAELNMNNVYIDGNIVGDVRFNANIRGNSVLDGTFKNANVIVADGSLKFNQNTFADADTTLNISNSTLNLVDGYYKNYVINDLIATDDVLLDIDLNICTSKSDSISLGSFDGTSLKIDKFNITGSKEDIVNFTEVIILNGGVIELSENALSQLKEYSFDTEHVITYKDGSILSNKISWDDAQTTIIDTSTKYGIILNDENNGLKLDVDENIQYSYTDEYTLALFNQSNIYGDKVYETTNSERSQNISKDLGETFGKLTVQGVINQDNISTINLNNHSGFILGQSSTGLVLDSVKILSSLDKEGSVVYVDNNYIELLLNDVSLETSSNSGSGIYTTGNLTIGATGQNSSIFKNTIENSSFVGIYLSGTGARELNLIAENDARIELHSGLRTDDGIKLTLNINNDDAKGFVQLALKGDLGSETNGIESLNLNGGTFSVVDNSSSTIYTDNLNLMEDTVFGIDINCVDKTADRIVINGIYTENITGQKLLLDVNNINIVNNEYQSMKFKLLNILTATTDFIELVGAENSALLLGTGKDGYTYYLRLGLHGSVIVESNESCADNPVVKALNNTKSNSLTLSKDTVVNNYGVDEFGNIIRDGSLLSTKLTIKGKNSPVLSTANEIHGITIAGTDTILPTRQQFVASSLTMQGFDGAVINKGGKVSLTSVNLIANETEENGSAIRNIVNDIYKGSVTLKGLSKKYAQVYDNFSSQNGGAIYNEANLTLQYVQFGLNENYYNYAINGGAIYTSGLLKSTSNRFYNNVAEIGGAVYVNAPNVKASAVTLSSNTFIQNRAEENGGAVYIENGLVTISKSNFGTTAVNSGNKAQNGGAIYNSGAVTNNKLSISSSKFYYNTAETLGGAIYNSGLMSDSSSSYLYNIADDGGAVYNTSTLTVSKSSYTSNTSKNSGGAIYNAGTICTVNAKTNAVTGGLNSAKFVNNSAKQFGGAIFNEGLLGIKSSTFTGNIALSGAGIFNSGNGAEVTSISSTYTNNVAELNGGAIYNDNKLVMSKSVVGKANVVKKGVIRTKNSNDAQNGAGVYNVGTLVDTSSSFTNNIASNSGGAIYNSGDFTSTGTKYTSNKASVSGGAVYSDGTMKLSSNTFSSNNADFGGGIYNAGEIYSETVVVPSTEDSDALVNYGGIYASKFTSNTANENGGGIYNAGTLFVGRSTFSTNKANMNGGAIFNNNNESGKTNIQGSTFSKNNALRGGAIYNDGNLALDRYDLVSVNSKGKVSHKYYNNSFTSNTATDGGAVYNNGSLDVNYATFKGNKASNRGGALYLADNNSVTTVKNSSFTSNSAVQGGAIYVGEGAQLTIEDTSFSKNSASDKGGAIYMDADSKVIINAIYRDVVFSGNKANKQSNSIYMGERSDLTLYANEGRRITIKDKILAEDSAKIHLEGNGIISIVNKEALETQNVIVNPEVTTSLQNHSTETTLFKSVTVTGANSRVALDMDMQNRTSDKIQAEEVIGEGTLTASTVNLVNNSKSPVTIEVGKDSIVNSISTKKAESAEATYKLKSYYDENGLLRVVAYGQKAKPAAVAAPVAAQIGGYLTQINSYDQAFMNMDMNMLKTREERQAETMRNQYALSTSGYSDYNEESDISYNSKGLWNRPYATFERVNLNNGPKVNNIGYGNYFGGDADMKTLKNGWKRQFSAYIGYNGSVQDYNSQSIDQNGGTVGVTEVWYKNNFFTGLTLNAGANVAQASTDLGRENMPMFMTGIASKSGYNFEFKEGKFIVQPSILLSYSFIHTFSHDNGKGSHVGSSPLNAIQVAPGIKFIANLKNGWQPYLGVNMRWNIIDKTHFSLQDVNIPDMSIDPYVEYGIGLQRRWGERFTGFGQAMIRNGGRNGVMLSFGFKWLIGK